MKKGNEVGERSGKEEATEEGVEELHEFEDDAGGLFCALYVPDANRYGHGPHPTVISVYGGDLITTSLASLSFPFFSLRFLPLFYFPLFIV